MRINIHIETEDAVEAVRIAQGLAAILGVEGTTTTSTRTRRTAAQIAADKATEDAAKAAAGPAAETKPDAVEQYLALSGTSSAQPDTAKPSNPPAETAAGPVDPMEAILAAATAAETKPAAPTKTRDEMIADIVKLMSSKGTGWARENMIVKYKVTKFADASDELVTQMYVENCV